ncbi:porin family protein [Flavihumibacter fluvii]|uniref:porin family protein n=1 Tax=Flavihumibacter fluvii TaxID=2838157 RepID=UPI001BDEA530|nr:porin family protein [Flavihumibacter fluvii]ULQ53662.1 PorT family protein [Flavihumibacter fluvii]
MKKILMLLLVSAFTGAGNAQPGIKYGFQAGVNLADIDGEANQQLNNLLEWTNGMVQATGRTGFHAGGFIQIPLSGKLVLEPALLYSSKGYTLKGKTDFALLDKLGIGAKAELQSHYIDLPVMLKATIGSGFQVFAGPRVSYLANAGLKAQARILGINLLNQKWEVTDQFNRWDAGIKAGLGYQFSKGLNLSVAYDYGLSKIDAAQSVDARNQVVSLSVGMRF